MKNWKKLDLAGRGFILLAVAFQLTLVSELQASKSHGDVYYLMENQSYMASMIKNLSSMQDKNNIANLNSDKFSKIKLYSEWSKSNIHKQVRIVNIIFIAAFLIGTILTIIARYLEIGDKPKST